MKFGNECRDCGKSISTKKNKRCFSCYTEMMETKWERDFRIVWDI